MNFGMCYYPEYYKLSEADKMISEDIDNEYGCRADCGVYMVPY